MRRSALHRYAQHEHGSFQRLRDLHDVCFTILLLCSGIATDTQAVPPVGTSRCLLENQGFVSMGRLDRPGRLCAHQVDQLNLLAGRITTSSPHKSHTDAIAQHQHNIHLYPFTLPDLARVGKNYLMDYISGVLAQIGRLYQRPRPTLFPG
ncbi:hypothetical protein F5I97DRAFT_774243 [Phlebopus sp. FC_14]|nr:hypothetical protein F5I97DRAFT_774243 [Phlebopus sp. FC_14]